MRTDLHIHTYFSDGVFSPEKIVDTAIDVGLQAIAITDHDNVLAYDVAQKHIKDNHLEDKIEVIRGIEVNTLYKNHEVHILGYFMNTKDKDFVELLKNQQQARIKQTKEIISLLAKKEGIKIKFESKGDVPSELVTASGSGLDPDISVRGAEVQIRRVAASRGMSEDDVRKIVEASVERPWLGLFGTYKVNVLKLNVALDKAQGR